ncbi:hypothetical protein [uncultured Brevibacillus sp.]|uniref:hypothetical protein n=1 Tax=uncultured Brevibacillus sp. TaxID=169970 RepID=UPI002592B678|nr:hypothetical protein [uncultured Brevibacillus sp.]
MLTRHQKLLTLNLFRLTFVPSARDLASSLTPVFVNVSIAVRSTPRGWVTTNMRLIDVSWSECLFVMALSPLFAIFCIAYKSSYPLLFFYLNYVPIGI